MRNTEIEMEISECLNKVAGLNKENTHEFVMSKIEKPLLKLVLERSEGNQVRAAKTLGINRNTLRKRLKKYGLMEAYENDKDWVGV